MKHEARCLHIPCTCVEILREREFLMQTALSLKNTTISDLETKIASLKKKIEDGLSCCCSGCSRHNQILSSSDVSEDQQKYMDQVAENLAKDPQHKQFPY